MTSFGFTDAGGGTAVPRHAALELARRGWEVTVFYAAVTPTEHGLPYELSEREQDGVTLIGVHNRPHGLFDLAQPRRELDDPPITEAFAAVIDRVAPDVVHFHNLHNLGAALIDEVSARGLPAFFSTHNYWLICPRAYLLTGEGVICPGPGDGSACASCAGGHDPIAYRDRLESIRARATRGLRGILAVSESVRRTLLAAGYPDELVEVVRQAMPQDHAIWEAVGARRPAGRTGEALTVAFLGSAYPHKGPQLLVEAAQRTRAEVRVEILGEVPERFAAALTRADRRGVTRVHGAFTSGEIGGLLRSVDAAVLPSMWWDCAPLAAAECRAAGLPLIVPRLGGLPETVRDGVDGLLFDPLDADDLAHTLDRLAGEPGLLERLQSAIEPPRPFAEYVDALELRYRDARAGALPAAPAPVSGPATVRWQGDHGLATSLSIINDEVTARLTGPVQRVTRDRAALDPPLPQLADVEVRHQWPPDLGVPAAGRLAAIVPWEFGAIPEEWVAPIEDNVDELWVPSEYVRSMYLDAGVAPDRVVVVPNGVAVDVFAPADRPPREGSPVRFLFVGGVIHRKGPDLLLAAWREAFAGRDDVTLVVKDFGAGGVYRDGERGPLRAHAASGALPRIELIEDELEVAELVELYRGSDVLVHPYRGEGFAMPVLEAMACGLPVIVTAGGPTDEFCPAEAGWRIDAHRRQWGQEPCIGAMRTTGIPWMLEPDPAHLVALLREAADDAEGRRRRGRRGREAAEALSWQAVAQRYEERIERLRARPPRRVTAAAHRYVFEDAAAVRVLASPAWRGRDDLSGLLADWAAATSPATDACLYLLADPHTSGSPEDLETHVLAAAAAAGVDLDACADIDIRVEAPRDGLIASLQAACDAYVPLHGACAGDLREAHTVLVPGSGGLGRLLAGDAQRPAVAASTSR